MNEYEENPVNFRSSSCTEKLLLSQCIYEMFLNQFCVCVCWIRRVCFIFKFGISSDSGFGGASAYGSSGSHTSSKKDNDGNDSPRKLDLDGLTPFEKNFYVESPAVAAMTDAEVEEYRKLREITVEGRDIPKPVKSFRDVGFPGKLISS